MGYWWSADGSIYDHHMNGERSSATRGNYSSVRCLQGGSEATSAQTGIQMQVSCGRGSCSNTTAQAEAQVPMPTEAQVPVQSEAKTAAQAEAKITAQADAGKTPTFIDSRDKKEYKTVKIGNQTWMAGNLNYAANGSKCYANAPENCATSCARLYDWNAAMRACPSGWHLPSDDEWGILEKAAGGSKTAGKHLKAKTIWNEKKGKPGVDTYGFTAIPCGYGNKDGKFDNANNRGYWWTATAHPSADANNSIRRRLDYDSESFEGTFMKYESRTELFSVRCVMD